MKTMNKKQIVGALALFIIFAATVVNAYAISGRVICEQNEPIAFATVALFSLPDSTLITGAMTNQNGEFSLNGNGSDAFLQISFIGHETVTVSTAKNQIVTLKSETTTLGEVVIQGNLPQIRLRDDAVVTTVVNTVLSKAGTGNDVLQRLPLLTGGDGSFSVIGRGEAVIYINNRLMRDPSELDRINSADIREVEIVTNPGARYDASVRAVIRIRTVRRAGDGFGFDVRSTFMQPDNVGTTQQLNVNYRRNGWDIFGTVLYTENGIHRNGEIEQKTDVDTLWQQKSTTCLEGRMSTLRGIAGINYEFSPTHHAGVRYTLTTRPNDRLSVDIQNIILADGEFYDRFSTALLSEARNRQPAHLINAYYTGRVGDLTVDFNTDFFANQLSTHTRATETSQEFDDRTVITNSDVSNRLIASRLIFSYPVLGGQITVGSEYTNTHRRDNFQDIGGIVASSNIIVNEQNSSIFAEFSRAISTIGQFRAGLRYENLRSEFLINDVRSDEQSRNYNQWFPNVSFSTRLQNVGLQLSYAARTQRPTFSQLSSNVIYVNRFTLETGNPFLKPATIHNIALTGTWQFIQMMVGYTDERNAIIQWAEQMEENEAIAILGRRNLDRLPRLTAFVSAAPTFGIWSPQASIGMTKQWLTITSHNEAITLNKPMFTASLNNSFSLPKGFLFTLDTRFRGKGNIQNVYMMQNQFVVNVGITKSFLNEQLRVELRGHDIFHGMGHAAFMYNTQMQLTDRSTFNSQRVELTARYRFNSARSRFRGTGAAQNQINRL